MNLGRLGAGLCAVALVLAGCSGPEGGGGTGADDDGGAGGGNGGESNNGGTSGGDGGGGSTTGDGDGGDSGGDTGGTGGDAGDGAVPRPRGVGKQMLSVAPDFALADADYHYSPRHTLNGDVEWAIVEGPSGMTLQDGRVQWHPTGEQRGSHHVELRARVGDDEVTQSYDLRVAGLRELTSREMQSGSLSVVSPTSHVRGAGIHIGAGGLEQARTLRINELDESPRASNSRGELRTVDFGPSGTTFDQPATLMLPFDNSGDYDVSRLGAYTYNTESGRWERVRVVDVDEDNGVVVARASHFSIYAAIESALDLEMRLERMDSGSTCEGRLVGRAELASPLSDLEIGAVNSLSDEMKALDATTVAELIASPAFHGSLRFVRVIQVGQGAGDSYVTLSTRLLVSTLYVDAETGEGIVTHTDAFGNVIGEVTFEDVGASATDIDTHLRGLTTHRVLRLTADQAYNIAGRVHIIYSPEDATLVGASVADLGPAVVDVPAGEEGLADEVSEGFDVDCDGYRAPYDDFDDSLEPRLVAEPEEAVTVVAGTSVLLSAQVVDSNEAPTDVRWSVQGQGGMLSAVEDDSNARSFVATLPGFYSVVFSASADGTPLETRFQVQVLPAPVVNTPPSCAPTALSNEMVVGEAVTLFAAVSDRQTPADALTVEWGLAFDPGDGEPTLVPSSSLRGGGTLVSFAPSSAGTYRIGCRAFDGTEWGAVASVPVGVLPPAINRAPRDFVLTPISKDVVVGGTVTFSARATDPEGDALTFEFVHPFAPGVATQTDATSSARLAVNTTGLAPGVYTVLASVRDGDNAPQYLAASLLVLAEVVSLDDVDADGDGFPASIDCNDADPAINQGALEICGDAGDVDENCDGEARTSDCDGDGYPAGSSPGEDCDDGNRAIGPHAAELCDGIDNDCDGIVDNGFEIGMDCEVGVGACVATGSLACTPSGHQALCEGTPLASSDEVCDGLDNDCDGSLDDDAGACVDEKVGVWWRCTDAFCSGLTDEGLVLTAAGDFANLSAPLGEQVFDPDTQSACASQVGTWESTGTDTLTVDFEVDQGPEQVHVTVTALAEGEMTLQFVDPDTQQLQQEHYLLLDAAPTGLPAECDFDTHCEPMPEMCNDLDDDCDFAVDEGGVCDGFCFCDTSTACDGQPNPCPCDVDCGEPTCVPQSEICDGVDNDCDGGIDEADVCEAATSGTDEALGRWFMCAEPGCASLDETGFMFLNDGTMWFLNPEGEVGGYDPAEPYCVNGGGLWERLSANQIRLEWEEQSDPGNPISLVVTTSTVEGFWHWSFNDPEEGTSREADLSPIAAHSAGACQHFDDCSGPELCNGYDDDCDGEVDEGFDVGPEVCDGADNDCDGVVDNLRPDPCTVAAGVGQCALGTLGCNGLIQECMPMHAPSAEYCEDGLDTDCDGEGGPSESGCAPAPEGEHCASATDVGAGGVFHDSLFGALDLIPSTCGDAPALPERVFRLDVPAGGREVYLNATPTTQPVCDDDGYDNDYDGQTDESGEPCQPGTMGGDSPLTLSALYGDCTGDYWCLHGSRVDWAYFEEGTYFLAVTSTMGPVEFDLSVAMRAEGGACSVGDGDGDGATICDLDCNDAVGTVYPGAAELCDGIDNDCNGGVDDLQGSCAVAGQQGACAVGRGFCGESGLVCEQITFAAAQEYCGDGVDNDCDGELDETGCTALAAGELCGTALPLSVGDTAIGTLSGALDNEAGNCGNPSHPELFYSFELAEPTEVIVDVRDLGCGCDADPDTCDTGCACDALCAPPCACDLEPGVCEEGCGCDPDCGGGGTGGDPSQLVWKLTEGGCDLVALEQSGCESPAWGMRQWYLEPGTHFVMVQGPEGQDFEVVLATYDEGACVPGDTDGDGYTICDGDCAEGDGSRNPDAVEVCNGLDDDCDGVADDIEGTCTVGGQQGLCDQGHLVCQGGEPTCVADHLPGEHDEVCDDGLDNDCDGTVDENVLPGDCTALVAGDTCSLAIPVPSASAVTATLDGALDDVALGCTGDRDPEIFFAFDVPDLDLGNDVRTSIQVQVGPGQDPGQLGVELLRGGACDGEGWGCTGVGVENWWLEPGPHALVVSGADPVDVEVLLAFEDPNQGSCSLGDLDGDGFDVCGGDCFEGNVGVFPGQVELCDGIDNDCNWTIDDVHGPCTVPDQVGACAQGERRCEGTAEACEQVVFPSDEICGDGVDNDCDGELDESDPGGCTSVPPGELCALPIDVTEGGVFAFDLGQASDDGEGCVFDAPEVYFSFTLGAPGEVSWQVRDPNGAGPLQDIDVGVRHQPGCGELDYCTGPMSGDYFEAGTYVLVVEGHSDLPLELAVGFGDGEGGCLPGDGDGDDWTLCQGDCNDDDIDVFPGQEEVCNGIDDDCSGLVDDVFGACSTGMPGICGQGQRACTGMTEECVADVTPGTFPDWCFNGLDDDCNGSIDDNCVEPAAGDFCEVARPLPMGPVDEVIAGSPSYQSPCHGPDPERIDTVYGFQVPTGGAWLDLYGGGEGDAWYDVYEGLECSEWMHRECLYEEDYAWLPEGDYHLVVTALPGTQLDFEVVLTQSVCGDGIFDPGEQCDDGNHDAGDGCAPDCTLEGGGGGACGDTFCDDFAGEDPCSCPADCGEVFPEDNGAACLDGVDNNCDGMTDCDDSMCMGLPECGGGGDAGTGPF